jgi:hypothetical protein
VNVEIGALVPVLGIAESLEYGKRDRDHSTFIAVVVAMLAVYAVTWWLQLKVFKVDKSSAAAQSLS